MGKPKNEGPKNDSPKKADVVRKEKDEKSEKIKKPALKLRQEFDLGKHDVSPEDKIKEGYVSLAVGSVDVIPFSDNGKAESFYRNEVTQPCVLMLDLYNKNKRVFTDEAIAFIKANEKILIAINALKPKNKNEFAKTCEHFSKDQINGPDGVLNLLLAFNRVISKLPTGAVQAMTKPWSNFQFKIDLRHREERKVEINLYNPEIRDPNIGQVKLDISGLEVEKLMKTDGTFEVNYWGNYKARPAITISGKLFPATPASRELVFQLNINPRTKIVDILVFKKVGVSNVSMTFADFDAKVRANPSFMYGL